jgi:membrane-associated protein
MLTEYISSWIATAGYAGVLVIIFAETGLFFGFFLPGDSLLFTAGILASQHHVFDIKILVPSIIAVAFLGYQVGYWFGARLGHWLMRRDDSLIFKKRYVHIAHAFYEKHGGKALAFARLIPIARTFVPIVAGMGKMNRWVFVVYNAIGAVVWGAGVTLAGYYLGLSIPNAKDYMLWVIVGVIVLSALPALIHFFKNKIR